MKLLAPLFLLAVCLVACSLDDSAERQKPNPEPIDILSSGNEADGANKENAREQYFENIHRSAPGTDWQSLEAHNAMARHRKRQANRGATKSSESFADGLLTGEWFERGSKFTAGSVFDVVQDPDDPNSLFIMSAGGSIWKLRYNSERYSLVNHDIFFDREYLGLVPTTGGRNLIAYSGGRPMYSSDDGQSWEFADVRDNVGELDDTDVFEFFSPQVVGNTIYTLLSTSRSSYDLFRSDDGGERYAWVAVIPQTSGHRVTHLYKPPGLDRLFLLTRSETFNNLRLYEIVDNGTVPDFQLIKTVSVDDGGERARMSATVLPETDELRIFLQSDQQLFRSDDSGLNFTEMPELETQPWRYASIYVRPSDPDFVAYGAVELYVSHDGGETFEYPNRWYDYYDDPYVYLHADIMRLTEITDPNGERQMLVSNHGGLNRLNPADGLWNSIAREGLNVAQYYDVSTNPGDQRIIYAGSQDQGFQILTETSANGNEILGGYQDFSGDFGHTVFANEGDVFATAYPFGLVYAFWGVLNDEYNWASYRVEHGDEFIWIAPMMSPPRDDGEVIIYKAGGSSDSLSEGSHLLEIRLDLDGNSATYGEMTATNKPFDFIDAAAGNISAMTYSPLDPERFYVATEEGRFFRSDDEGENWTETIDFLPGGWYLYGQAIHASKTEPETVWLGGSGYSNPPVWRSTNGGQTFIPMSEGLPATTVNGLVANATESLLFAATEAGPFVYVASEERWFDLTGQFAPTMRYVSVEFIESRNLARFGTYGRGAWDFQVEELVSTEAPVASADRLRIFPNPASGSTTVEGMASGYRLYDVTGREVTRVTASGARTQVPLNGLKAGMYFVQPLDEAGRGAGLAARLVVE